jgi:hypothetical protein
LKKLAFVQSELNFFNGRIKRQVDMKRMIKEFDNEIQESNSFACLRVDCSLLKQIIDLDLGK